MPHITGALTVQVLLEYLQVWELLEDIFSWCLGVQTDSFQWKFAGEHSYSAASAYGAMLCSWDHPDLLGQRRFGRPKHLRRQNSSSGLLCMGAAGLQTEGSGMDYKTLTNAPSYVHNNVQKPWSTIYSRQVWSIILRRLHLDDVVLLQDGHALGWWLQVRKRVPKPVLHGLDSLFFSVSWSVWKERNPRNFRQVSLTPLQLTVQIMDEASEWCLAGYKQLRSLQQLLLTFGAVVLGRNGR